MDVLPSNVILDIFSRVPVKCLARSRCVSKVWCSYIDDRYLTIIHDKRLVEEPTPILYHQHRSHYRTTCSLCFHVIETKQPGTSHYVMEPKEGRFLEYLHEKPLSKYSVVRTKVRGFCNGLVCLSQDDCDVITSLAVIHPLRKECYELPPFQLHFDRHMCKESCGLGFDTSTNTWKMVCVFLKEYAPSKKPDMVRKKLCTMVHVFGTNSWREIPQVPSRLISGKAVFGNGCLHWLASYSGYKNKDGGRPVVWFDVEKEEFGLIDPPKRMCDIYSFRYRLVDLNGEVGYVCTDKTMEFWLLNHKKDWVPHCQFKQESVPDGYIDVIGCWNKDGDILILRIDVHVNPVVVFYVYNLKSGVLHKTNLASSADCPDIFMYRNTLSSIHGINANSCFSMEKTILKKSCQHVLSNFY